MVHERNLLSLDLPGGTPGCHGPSGAVRKGPRHRPRGACVKRAVVGVMKSHALRVQNVWQNVNIFVGAAPPLE